MSCFKSVASHTQLPLGYLNSAAMTSSDVWSVPVEETVASDGLTSPFTFKSLELKTFPKELRIELIGITKSFRIAQGSKTTPSNNHTILDKLMVEDFQDLITEEFQSAQVCTISK